MKTTEPKSKILVIIISILLIANIVTLYMLMNNKGSAKDRPDRHAATRLFLKDKVGFNADQLTMYDSISVQHRREVKEIYDQMGQQREKSFKELAESSFNDSAIGINAAGLSMQQKDIEIKMLHHIKDVRNICTPAQLPAFDSGFYKLIARRSKSRK